MMRLNDNIAILELTFKVGMRKYKNINFRKKEQSQYSSDYDEHDGYYSEIPKQTGKKLIYKN